MERPHPTVTLQLRNRETSGYRPDLWGLISSQHFDDMPTIRPSGIVFRSLTTRRSADDKRLSLLV